MKKFLIAEDERTSRLLLEAILKKWGYEVIVTCSGDQAWEAMQSENPPPLAILDWKMPGMDGVEICRKVRESLTLASTYIILLTGQRQKEEVVVGLESGANDYIRKPFDREELHARIRVGERVIEMQLALAKQVKELQEALSQIKTLQGLIPICSYCKKIRNDQNYWQQLEFYISQHSQAVFSHGICPDCIEKIIKPELEHQGTKIPETK
jgi:sigma-B regulation protein RsbU (phosphoserine phosphatase)